MVNRCWLASGLFSAILLLPSGGAASAERPDLGSIVPEDVHFYLGHRVTEDRQKLAKPYEEAFRRLIRSGIGRDILDLATMDLPEDVRNSVRATARQVVDLLRTPRWRDLVRHEMSFSFKLSFPLPEYLFLFRVEEDAAGARRAELRDMLAGMAELCPVDLRMNDKTVLGGEVSTLSPAEMPFGVSVGSKKDVVAISTSDALLARAFGLMDREGTAGSIIGEGEFFPRAAAHGVETEVFFDIDGYMGFYRMLLDQAAAHAPDDPMARGALEIARTVIDEIARLGEIRSVDWTEGNEVVTWTRMNLVATDGPGWIETQIADQEPLEDFLQVVPDDASGFYFTAGLDPMRLSTGIRDLVRSKLPGGEKILQKWDHLQRRFGFHFRDHLFSWIDGGVGWVTLPGAHGGLCSEHVLFVRVKDREKAADVLRAAKEKIRRFLSGRGQHFEVVEVPGLDDAFHEVRIRALPWLRPVVGLPGDLLVVGSSAAAVKRVAAAYRDQAPSFSGDGLHLPDGPVFEAFYADMKDSLKGLANVLGGAGFLASLVPEHRDTRQLRKLGEILTKLSYFLRDVDLPFEYDGWTRYDAEAHALVSRMSTRLRIRSAEESDEY